jgi:hypothetical protein
MSQPGRRGMKERTLKCWERGKRLQVPKVIAHESQHGT